ncbi:glycine--tRNA ligase subunit beta [Alkalihalophilus pseudofirmus]|uniref:glycine--tRNA ligase subunit beta n=1 Tax=Alkalihalophilus pseudofirmus TaxID=79885 RepID=UPI00259BB116|nr:glycine--tRNA ligase subunit beta [Alkalihalophilus pseudofirmus]WEG18016.1 glycine--tRNA ligase subunit beta [Alkalihalophilus pseudofirmus]
MSKRDFLFELGLEELPARFVTDSMNQLKNKVSDWLKEERLDFDAIEAFSTPRRLAIYITGLAEKQPDVEAEAKGPAKKIAQDEEGNWSKAALGFARGQGVTADDLFFKELKGVEYVYAKTFTAGKKTVELLPALKSIVTSMHFPKNMRWNQYDLRFARPIQWMVALYGEEIIPFEITDVKTSNTTRGHRFLGEEVKLDTPADYETALLGQYVIARPEERKRAIRNQIESMTEGNGWVIPIDEDLLEEVTNLVEYPTALSGTYDDAFLEIPKEVLITSMREHQRYFPVEDTEGKLLPHFVTVRNGDHQHLENVAKGNEKVLRARLSDAAFFYAEDQKLKIEDALGRLENIVYHEDLGSIADKVRRVRKGVTSISKLVALDSNEQEVADRIAEIAKFDLVTQMVYEFPELQGRMGEVYAGLIGEPVEVTVGIKEHYMPKFAGDKSPSTKACTVVSLADKLDTIVTCFAIGLIPTGSQDPYALRRQAAGIVQMISDYDFDVKIDNLVSASLDVAEERGLLKRDREDITKEVMDFFSLRIKNALQEKGIRYDVTDAVLTSEAIHVPTTVKKAELLMGQVSQPAFKKTVEALSRVTNIAKKAETAVEIKPELFEKEEEKELYRQYESAQKEVQIALAKGDASRAFKSLQSIEPSIHAYFDHIMVMAEDEKVKRNRLAQMLELSAVIRAFANFQSIVFS